MTDAELVRAAVQASGMSTGRWAILVAHVGERTVRRWIAGQYEIGNPELRERIARQLARHTAAQAARPETK